MVVITFLEIFAKETSLVIWEIVPKLFWATHKKCGKRNG
jgi:hypothetical protein